MQGMHTPPREWSPAICGPSFPEWNTLRGVQHLHLPTPSDRPPYILPNWVKTRSHLSVDSWLNYGCVVPFSALIWNTRIGVPVRWCCGNYVQSGIKHLEPKGVKIILTIRNFLGKNIKNEKDTGKRPWVLGTGTISKQVPVRQLSGARSAQIYFKSSEGQKVTGWRKKVFYWVTNLKVNFNLKKLKQTSNFQILLAWFLQVGFLSTQECFKLWGYFDL